MVKSSEGQNECSREMYSVRKEEVCVIRERKTRLGERTKEKNKR